MVKGLTFESREESVILEKAMNPTGGAIIRRVDCSRPWDAIRNLIVLLNSRGTAQCGPACLGGVGAGGEKPPATRFCFYS